MTKTFIVMLDENGKVIAALTPAAAPPSVTLDLKPRSGQTAHQIDLPADITDLNPQAFSFAMHKAISVPDALRPHPGQPKLRLSRA